MDKKTGIVGFSVLFLIALFALVWTGTGTKTETASRGASGGGGVRASSSDQTWDKVWYNDDNKVFSGRAATQAPEEPDYEDLTPEQLGELATAAGPEESENACDKMSKNKRGLGSLAVLVNALARDPMNFHGD